MRLLKMARPRRAAASRALELFQKGFGVDNVENFEIQGMSADEEQELDLALLNVVEDVPEEENVRTDTGRLGDGDGNCTDQRWKSYNDFDTRPPQKPFRPRQVPGPTVIQDAQATRHEKSQFTTALDFFRLFFTAELIQLICDATNTYAWMHVLHKTTYANKNGAWDEMFPEEFERFLACIIFMGFVKRPTIAKYWATSTLYSGGWAKRFMSRDRFKALLGMLHISDLGSEDPNDKLTKVKPLITYIKAKCMSLYQPHQNMAIDERMVRSKARSGMRQFLPNKRARFGFKLWCLCDSVSGYTVDFDVYTGRRENPGENGLAFDVVMKLVENYHHQGYRLWFDNFYTSLPLLKALNQLGFMSCGTTVCTRRGFPEALKDKQWTKTAKRGDMRYVRLDGMLALQWMDNRPVAMCTTMHEANTFQLVRRTSKDRKGVYQAMEVKQPQAVFDYNQFMGGVDKSDQIIGTYNVLMKCVRWWKTIFFHIVDIAIVNSYLLFTEWQRMYPDEKGLHRPQGYAQLAFREELVRQLAGISEDEKAPAHGHSSGPRPSSEYHTAHTPEHIKSRINCHVCYSTKRKEVKTSWRCKAPQCKTGLCLTGSRNCFARYHSGEFDGYRKPKND